MSKHTRGPWSHHEKGAHPYPFVCAAPVATEYGEDSFVVAYLVGADTTANARLIAAAPDLLEALQSILKGYEAGRSGAFASDVALAAIAKVESRS